MEKDIDSTYNKLQDIYNQYFSLGFLGNDISVKFALISLIGYLTFKAKKKYPNITCKEVIKKLASKLETPKAYLDSLAILCSDLSYGCKEFPTFGIEDKKIPNKIVEILKEHVPF